jgi:predicted ester cyclase
MMGDVWPDDLRSWFADYLEALNRHDLTALREFTAPDVRRAHLPGGAEAWMAELDALFAALPDLQWRRIGLVVEDDRVAAHLRVSGTHRGVFQGIAPTGRHLNVAEFGIYRVANGRIAEYAGTADPTELAARLRS